ncbi:DUF2726 domain-containing protein [Vibrio ponticus]|uniref:DUF2726 domain-containing protein n=1 Tax=Vibrio ponticus TaxID=265668 RepID=A0A3N3DV04_9VIBR|nr:DUF2726 domain-containing protein [Vibrio ponticus]ROV58307.1 DUF2726 domain-containing protein [Vibrio ponticus]
MLEIAVIAICLGVIVLKLMPSNRNKRRVRDRDSTSNQSTLEASVPHKKFEYLTTENERKFHSALRLALPNRYMIHCQTSLMALVQPIDRKNCSRTWAKRMDFVITDNDTKVIAVIELDDKSHQREKRQKRDEYVNGALSGNHKLIRFQAKRDYDVNEIATVLDFELNLAADPSVELMQQA